MWNYKRKTLPNGKIQYVVYKDDIQKMSTVSMLEAQSYVDAHNLEDKNKRIAADRLAVDCPHRVVQFEC